MAFNVVPVETVNGYNVVNDCLENLVGQIGPNLSPWIPGMLGLATLVLMLRCLPKLAGLTLQYPFRWAVVAVSAVTLSQAWLLFLPSADSGEGLLAIQFSASMLLCCPGIALLGAKRPQNRGWTMVVICLLSILILPVAELLFLPSGRSISLGSLRSSFLLLLLVMGWLNYWGTRHMAAATVALGGQLLLLAPHLPLLRYQLPESSPTGGMAALLIATILVTWRGNSSRVGQAGGNRLWIDFRDQFGVFWGLRLAERFNEQAREHDWKTELRWGGFHRLSSDKEKSSQPMPPTAQRYLESLLSRFVSRDWIARRMTRDVE